MLLRKNFAHSFERGQLLRCRGLRPFFAQAFVALWPVYAEQSTKVGLGVPFGAEIKLGPGALIGELLFEYGSLDHTATGDSNTGALSLAIGYRLLL